MKQQQNTKTDGRRRRRNQSKTWVLQKIPFDKNVGGIEEKVAGIYIRPN